MALKVHTPNNFVNTTKITDLYPEIMLAHILTLIDHSSLASTALASTQLHALCNHEYIWTKICNSKWHSTKFPVVRDAISSFPGGHRLFFADAYLILEFSSDYKYLSYNQRIKHLISAVDIQFEHKNVYSKVDVIDTTNESFASSVFEVEVLDRTKFVRLPMKSEDEDDSHISNLKMNMTLSWILIDPTQKRAANVSSQLPVSVRRHWIGGDIEVKYAIVMPRYSGAGMSELVEIRIIVMLEWEEDKTKLKLRKVSLQIRDMDNICLQGSESLRILQEAIQCRTRIKAQRAEVIDKYKIFVNKKRARREGRQKRKIKITGPLLATIVVGLVILCFRCF
ncbi:hypothetical protein DCAR_0313846 [Daucus carota subsp. sativus]|uniref:F-box domain-containing protein n=1 Tax=Daucus carota subsp. sativus TaxID=79200 RepID=A0A161Y2S9_DAUCS|nr:PREDICTED: probable F-box protein At1g60180 [Daucus carota subsp. sativus]WOG94550.1 hypothetical protein DCAR_0313846 [Daucus carota subsp. sativus]